MTGSKTVYAAVESTNSPHSKARRHLNTWFAFTPCARATSETLAPGAIANWTICRFSDTDRHLRTRCPEPVLTASAMSRSSAHRRLNHQKGTQDAYCNWG